MEPIQQIAVIAGSATFGRPHGDLTMQRLLEAFLDLSYIRVLLIVLSFFITAMLLIHLWSTQRDRSVLGKIGWSLVVCVPLVGWVLYGGLAAMPKPHGERWRKSDGLE
jgi:hypothetical protein